MAEPRDHDDLVGGKLTRFYETMPAPKNIFPRFWTLKDGIDYEAQAQQSRRHGVIQRCGKCKRGVIAHGGSLLRNHCIVCFGEVRKVSA